jgi:hypothetical protein
VVGTLADVVLSSVEKYGFSHVIWICDSCKSCYYCNNDDGLYNDTAFFEEITVGNDIIIIAEKIGKFRAVRSYKKW